MNKCQEKKLPTIQERLRNESPYETPRYINMVEEAADHIDDLEKLLSLLPEKTESKCFSIIMSALATLAMVDPIKAEMAKEARVYVDELKIHIKSLKEGK